MIKIPCVYMRTGTSKSVYFKKEDHPADLEQRDRYLLAIMGSPDTRQINGLGGGDVSTSKIAILSRSARDGYDIDYTFGQVSLKEAKIDYSINCGNCSSGVGPFAVTEGLVAPQEPETIVPIYNTNTKELLIETVRVKDGKVLETGDCHIDGVPGTGAPIDADFKDTVGASTGTLFPTGHKIDILSVAALGEIPVTIADVGNPVVFFEASSIGATGYESRAEINAAGQLLEKIESVRQAAAEVLGLVKPGQCARTHSSMKPLVVMFAPPKTYPDYVSGAPIAADSMVFSARNLMNQLCIDTFAVTAALCTGVAASVDGTVLTQSISIPRREDGLIRIGHSRGIGEVFVKTVSAGKRVTVEKAVTQRTARRIMEGYAFPG